MCSPSTRPDHSPVSAAPLQVSSVNDGTLAELHCDAGKATRKAAFPA